MRRIEIAYVVAVVAFAGAFGTSLFVGRGPATTPGQGSSRPKAHLRRRARQMDLLRVQQLIKDGRLSGREAEFYRAVPSDAGTLQEDQGETARGRNRRRVRGGRDAKPEDRTGGDRNAKEP